MFSLSKYEDSSGVELSIIKDWKDMLTQVGDNQSLLQSLKDSPYFKGTCPSHSIRSQFSKVEFRMFFHDPSLISRFCG